MSKDDGKLTTDAEDLEYFKTKWRSALDSMETDDAEYVRGKLKRSLVNEIPVDVGVTPPENPALEEAIRALQDAGRQLRAMQRTAAHPMTEERARQILAEYPDADLSEFTIEGGKTADELAAEEHKTIEKLRDWANQHTHNVIWGTGPAPDPASPHRYIRIINEHFEFEGIAWMPGQEQLNNEMPATYPEGLVARAVKRYTQEPCSMFMCLADDASTWDAAPMVEHAVAAVQFVEEGPDGSIRVRGRLLTDTPKGSVLRDMWVATARGMGIVPWEIGCTGYGRTKGHVVEKLTVTGFCLDRIDAP